MADGDITLAVDCGVRGAFAWVTGMGHLIDVTAMPTIEVRGKRRIDAAGVRRLMLLRPVTQVVIEGVGAMPRMGKDGQPNTMGAASSFNFGYGAGLIEGVAVGVGCPVEIIMARVWKNRAQVPADKDAAREMALRMWPGAAKHFSRKIDDGKAEACLMARWYGRRAL